jgi:RNA polymerase sigma-70 factor, ECF subfamily
MNGVRTLGIEGAMKPSTPNEISLLLRAWECGDPKAFDKLAPLVYDELHRMAHRYMAREHAGHMLQTTALVNEAYLRLMDVKNVEWRNRAHFFAISANLMRRILVDFARSRGYQKRGGNMKKVSLDNVHMAIPGPDSDIAKIDDALSALAQFDSRKAKIVELRFFGGLNLDETAEVLGISRDTVNREWKVAKIWLLSEIKSGGEDET